MTSFPLPDPMRRALALAEVAGATGDVPVGAVVTGADGAILGEGRNRMRADHDPSAHAEVVALRAAGQALGSSRLDGCTLWVTLEPCAMCAGAIAIARIATLHIAASDPKGGGVLNGPRLFDQPTCHHRPQVDVGLGEDHAAAMLRDFFRTRRR